MIMKKLMAALAALTLSTPVLAEPDIKNWNTHHSMGCMLLRECTEGTQRVRIVEDLIRLLDIEFDESQREELNDIFTSLNEIGVEFYVADSKYFVSRTRGIYSTKENKFFINPKYLPDAESVVKVIRHEGWHTAQDCMAGSLENTQIAIIWNDGVVPQSYQLKADILYAGGPAVPWEKEAMWAMDTESMTANALRACAAPEPMWWAYPPTQMTGEWLVENGYWDGVQR